MDRIAYGGWKNCYRLANRAIELVVTGDVGPRVIRLATKGGTNLFKEFKEQMGQTGGDEWRIYGGHRLWHAPEAKPRTYCPDNSPADVKQTENGLTVTQAVESTTGILKQMSIILDANQPHVRVLHRLTNCALWPVALSPWALSVMAPGGTAIIPQAAYISHQECLVPARPVVLWPYTNMRDKRWIWGEKFIQLRQDRAAKHPQKVGVALVDGWAAYALKGQVFLKRFDHLPNAEYPDFGCSFETFTNADMLEVETLGPMTTLEPGASAVHVEDWFVFDGIRLGKSEQAIEEALAPILKKSAKMMGG
ncbi:MAG TPA: hypothetical protein VM141_02795 [Planctomycetota bacterium]|nr:hypothetical protein [Planctomycetota bacterium]